MSTKMIEQQLTDLRNRVATLEARVERKPRNGFLKLAGWAKDDPIFDEAMRLGAEWRKRENRKSLRNASRR